MVAFYADKIKKGIITINEVPKLWREQVNKVLKNQN